ncbi:LemA family protein [Caproiciproducens galactitolivorans]|uniref:LemA family protein n=2 Tax=Caproiciproducens galactitolivorans TaxID=642589 RepID=A0A4Z0YGD8_9FIRM|nr:LemA family protein [Caproiciproducens galactitolivorans]QEY34278.1 LemA family protein [Caproiciproducens galactitolivorans]TGJ77960.1 LemA family protein [Caproiciproducens galactitolivorans]
MNPIIIALIAIVLILLFWAVGMYNRLVSLSVRVDNGWAQVDVQLKKRFDLIPNLVETVKGYATHEKTTLEEVTKWRGAAINAKTPEEAMENNAKLSRAIVNLFATAEQYPDLKANQNFLDLQSQLKDIEGKIAMARQFYNDTAMKYNEYVLHFPSNLIASMFHFGQKKYFEIAEADKAVPQVKF